MGLEFGVKVDNMARDNGLCVCVGKPHGVTDKPLGEAILHGSDFFLKISVKRGRLSGGRGLEDLKI